MGSSGTQPTGLSFSPLAIFERLITLFARKAGSDPTHAAIVFYLSLAIVVSVVVVVALSATGTVQVQATVVIVGGMISVVVLVLALMLFGDKPVRNAEAHRGQLRDKKSKYEEETSRSRNG
ncbi:MAG: hypothetical protein IH861_08985 [Chloroflexi bacterium]|nr:hypothetical protein [Chloroflexota bacterium]